MEQIPLKQQISTLTQKNADFSPPLVKSQDVNTLIQNDNGLQTMLSNLGTNVSPKDTLNTPKNHSKADYQLRFNSYSNLDNVDATILERYCDFCLNNGLSPEQAQQAVDFYLAEQKLANSEGSAHCEAILRQLWQGNFQRRLNLARHAAHVMDKRLDGRLAALLAAGLGNNPVFAELMALVGEALSEDSLGLSNTGTELFSPMSTEEFLRTEVFNNTNK